MSGAFETPWQIAAERAFGSLADGIGLKPVRDAADALQKLVLAQADELGAYAALANVMSQACVESLARLPAQALAAGNETLASPFGLLRLWSADLDAAMHAAMLSDPGLAATAQAVRATSRRRLGTQRLADVAAESLGAPSRREIDDAHREIQQLKREMRQLKQALALRSDGGTVPSAAPAPAPARKRPRKTARKDTR